MKKWKNFALPKRLIFKIIVFFNLIALCQTLAMGIVFQKNTEAEFQEKISTFMETYAKNISDSTDAYITEVDRMSKIILGNPQIQDALRNRNSQGYTQIDRLRDERIIDDTITSFTSLQDNTYISLGEKDGTVVFRPTFLIKNYMSNLLAIPYIQNNIKSLLDGEFLIVPPGESELSVYGGRSVFLFCRALRDLQTNAPQGYIVVIFDERALGAKVLKARPDISKIWVSLSDEKGSQLISMGALDQKVTYRKSVCVSPLTGWTTTVEVPEAYLKNNFSTTNTFFTPLIVTLMLGSLLLSLFLFFYVLHPIAYLREQMKIAERGIFDLEWKQRARSRDMQELFDGFRHMLEEVKKLTGAMIQEKLYFKDAQLAALQYQINPHFLYNTLQTVEAIAEVREVSEIQLISKSLGDLLRYNLYGPSIVTLQEEILQMDTYLKIEEIRFGNSMSYEIYVPKELEECRVLKFILQPIVENSIVHGFRHVKGQKTVRIEARAKHGTIYLTVYNSGAPMEFQKLEELRKSLEKISSSEASDFSAPSVGLINVHSRLVSKFGPEYGVRIEFSDRTGTCVCLSMPESREEKKNVSDSDR